MSHRIPNKVWDEIIYSFPNIHDCTIEVWEWMSIIIPRFILEDIFIHEFEVNPC